MTLDTTAATHRQDFMTSGNRPHNPKVEGSNPSPATNLFHLISTS